MSDYEAYRINAFGDESVANQVDRRWKNARVNGREPANLATDQGFQPQNRGGLIGIIPQDIADARRPRSTSRRRPATSRTLQALERTIDGPGRGARPQGGHDAVARVHRRSGARRGRRAIDAARRANVAVYFVDARGLVVGAPAPRRRSGPALARLARHRRRQRRRSTLSAEGAERSAQNTGGFSVRNQNDLGRGLQRIGVESRVYYLLGFQPDRDAKPGVFRRLRGEDDAAGRDGAGAPGLLRRRHRSGHVARPVAPERPPQRRRRDSPKASTRSTGPPSRPTSSAPIPLRVAS